MGRGSVHLHMCLFLLERKFGFASKRECTSEAGEDGRGENPESESEFESESETPSASGLVEFWAWRGCGSCDCCLVERFTNSLCERL
jgi:hypothetical protein